MTTFFAVTVTVTMWSPGMSVMCATKEAVAWAETRIFVSAPGSSVPAAGLAVMCPPPVATVADQCTVLPKPMIEMSPVTVAPLVETSDIDVGSTIRTGFGGGVYVEADTEGAGRGARVAGATECGDEEGLGPGGGDGLRVPVLTASAEVVADAAGERVSARATFGLAVRRGLVVGLADVSVARVGTPAAIPVGLLTPEAASRLDGEPPARTTTSTATTATAPTTAATAAAVLGARRGLATITGLGNPS
ncbi:MAG TPA: hypothetical protein VGG16_20420 [Streptosporangiaceae bacterium]